MAVVRGFRHDYDRWASYTGDTTWDYAHVLTYFKKMEDMRVPELRESGETFIIIVSLVEHRNPFHFCLTRSARCLSIR